MKFGIFLLAITPLLCSCATALYDNNAYQAAIPARNAGIDQCNAKFAGNNFKTSFAQFDCLRDVEKTFAVAIKLKKIELYDRYAVQLVGIAYDADRGRISMAERNKQFASARDAYFQTLWASKAAADQQNQAAYSVLGNGLSAFATGYAQGQAAQASHAPVMTTCTTNGTITNCLSN